jgi:hypothetical protein
LPTSGYNYETLLRLNQVGKQYVKILNEPFVLSYLAAKWLDKSQVKDFDDLVKLRETYHFTPRCLQYRSTTECLKLSAKDGYLSFINKNLRFVDFDELLNELIVIAMENHNVDIVDFLLATCGQRAIC